MSDLFKRSFLPYLLFVIGAILILAWFKHTKTEGFASPKPKAIKCDKQYYFDMYYVDWCQYCTKALPEFQALGTTLTIGDKTVACEAFEYEKMKKKHAKNGFWGDDTWKHFRGNSTMNPVVGYPTIRLYSPSGGMIAEYEGARTAIAMKEWLKENINRPTLQRQMMGCDADE